MIVNSIEAQGDWFQRSNYFLIFTPKMFGEKRWTQLDMKAPIWFRMGYIGEFKVHQPVLLIQVYIYLTFYHQPTTQFWSGKRLPRAHFPSTSKSCEVAFVVRSFGSSSYGLWWQAETWTKKPVINVFCLNEKSTEKSFKNKTCNLN